MESKCPFKVGTSVGLSDERLNAAKKELREYKEQNKVEEPDRKSFLIFRLIGKHWSTFYQNLCYALLLVLND